MTLAQTPPRTDLGLAAHVDAVLAASASDLSVYVADDDRWEHVPWRGVRARAHAIAACIRDRRPDGADTAAAVGLIGDPTPDLVAALLGAWLIGSPVSILPGPVRGADPHRWAETTLTRFTDLGADVVLGGGTDLELLARAAAESDDERRPTVERVDEIGLDHVGAQVDPDAVPDGAIAILQGTAGSTGDPKTAVVSADAVAANAAALAGRLRLDEATDVGLSWLPLYHDMGLTFLLAGLHTGIDLWIAPNSAFAASPFRWPQWLTESRATVTAAPNFAYDIVGRYGRLLAGSDLSSIRVAISGGEPIDPDAFDRFLTAAAAVGFDPGAAAPAYGMAESTCAVTMPAPGEGADYDTVAMPGPDGESTTRRHAILGRPVDGMQIRVVAPVETAPDIPGRRVGAIEVRGTSMMCGYRGHDPIAPDDWFPTGDLGYLVDGRLVVCGRAKEVVIVAGKNIFPAEIERAAAQVAGVRRGGVVAVARRGRRPGLVVIAETREVDDPATVRSAITAAVASDCGVVPADVVLAPVGAVPRTTSGKLRRLAARDLLEAGEWS
ncbi:long-chain-fatty acid--ACP ligase MbtM [Williamsia sp. SKLECPSW1]